MVGMPLRDFIEMLECLFCVDLESVDFPEELCNRVSDVVFRVEVYCKANGVSDCGGVMERVFKRLFSRGVVLKHIGEKSYVWEEALKLLRIHPSYRNAGRYYECIRRAYLRSLDRVLAKRISKQASRREWCSSGRIEMQSLESQAYCSDCVRLAEECRGSRGGLYYYVDEDNVLRRISSYSVKTIRRGKVLEHLIPMDRLCGKVLYAFKFTRAGLLEVRRFVIKSVDDLKKLGGYGLNYRFSEAVDVTSILSKSFEVRSKRLKSLLSQVRMLYRLMVRELMEYVGEMNIVVSISGKAKRASSMLDDLDVGVLECMVLQSDDSRFRCLVNSLKWIYQLWVMMKICKALGINEFVETGFGGGGSWEVTQGLPTPAFAGRVGSRYYTFWFEPQLTEGYHLVGMVLGRRAHVRPDIIVSMGIYSFIKEAVDKGVDLLVECKNTDYEHWREEIYTQIPDYQKSFKPKKLIIASLERVPDYAKEALREKNVYVVDELALNNVGAVNKLNILVREALL